MRIIIIVITIIVITAIDHQPKAVVQILMSRYDNNEMYTEALNTYAVITKNRMFNNAGKLKVMAFNGH